MGSITLLRRTPFPADEPRLLRAFETAIGPRAKTLRPELHNGDDQGTFHFFLWGPDSLDCHAYPCPLWELWPNLRTLCDGETDLSTAFAAHRASLCVESSPVDLDSEDAQRRVTRAVAELIDADTLLLADVVNPRLALCDSSTPDLLSTERWRDAFADGIPVRLW